MRVNLNIQWGYTFFLTWHCKTNYFKYKLCLVYNYMERYLFMLLWSTRKSFWMFFFFFLRLLFRGGTAKTQKRRQQPAQAPEGHYTPPFPATPQSNLFLHLLLSLHVLRCLYFIWPNDVVMWCFCSIPLQTLSNLWKDTSGTSAQQAT